MTSSGPIPTRVAIKRIYDPPSTEDGTRILVDRLRPRGVKKETAAVDHWLKEIAPGTALRRWFGHRPERWEEFKRRYAEELEANPRVGELRKLAEEGPLTLLYAANDPVRNNAAVLAAYLRSGVTSERTSQGG